MCLRRIKETSVKTRKNGLCLVWSSLFPHLSNQTETNMTIYASDINIQLLVAVQSTYVLWEWLVVPTVTTYSKQWLFSNLYLVSLIKGNLISSSMLLMEPKHFIVVLRGLLQRIKRLVLLTNLESRYENCLEF